MDFKALISKINDFDKPAETLTESAVMEKAVSKKQQRFMGMVHAAQKGEKPASKEVEKAAKGMSKKAAKDYAETKHKGLPEKKKAKKESVEFDKDAFINNFESLVAEAKAKPDFLDVDKDGDKKEPMKKATKEAGKGEKKETKGMTAAQKKLPPGLQKAIAKKKGKTESVKASKKVVAESVEQKLTFKDMLKLVQESGGQQQLDPMDKTLFAWASRVAQSKFEESVKAEVYAGLVYERMGGRFEMYDVLAEDSK